MNLSTTRLTKRLKIFDTALFCNIFYLLLVLIFKGIQGLLGSNGTYNLIYGVIEFVVVTFYWVGFNWMIFRKSGTKSQKVRITYILINMAPAIIFTLISILIIYVFPGYDFTTAWTQFSFAISPTLFWYLPYGYLYFAFGAAMPIGLFMVLCLVYAFGAQVVGVMIGASQQLHEEEHQKEVQRQKQRIARQKAAPVVSAEKPRVSPVRRRDRVLEATAANRYEKEDEDNPFRDDSDTEQIIYTEAISTITDEMIENSVQNGKLYSDIPSEPAEKTEPEKKPTTPQWEIPKKTRRHRK